MLINHLITMKRYLKSGVLELRDRLRHFKHSLTSPSQSTDQRSKGRTKKKSGGGGGGGGGVRSTKKNIRGREH